MSAAAQALEAEARAAQQRSQQLAQQAQDIRAQREGAQGSHRSPGPLAGVATPNGTAMSTPSSMSAGEGSAADSHLARPSQETPVPAQAPGVDVHASEEGAGHGLAAVGSPALVAPKEDKVTPSRGGVVTPPGVGPAGPEVAAPGE